MPIKYFKKVTEHATRLHPHHVHIVCQGTLSMTIVGSFVMHTISPLGEALGLLSSGLFAAWQRDIELRMINNLRRIAYDIKNDMNKLEDEEAI